MYYNSEMPGQEAYNYFTLSIGAQYRMLQDRLNQVKQKPLPYQPQKMEEEWKQLVPSKPKDFDKSPTTGVDKRC